MLLPLLFLLSMFQAVQCFVCYQCASNRAIVYWDVYDFPTAAGDSAVGDDRCKHDNFVSMHTPCKHYCVTVNITNADGKVLGIVRDCQKPSLATIASLETTETKCLEREVTIRRQKNFLRTCYCQGDYCNGATPQQRRTHRRGGTMQIPDSATVAPFFTVFVIVLSILL